MDIDLQVDSVLNRSESSRSRNHKHFWLTLGSAIVAFMIGTMLVLPIFNGRNGLDVLQSFFDSDGDVDVVVGDPPEYPDGSPYDYWYAPENSFGIRETKTVNWSYFKALFLAHTDWMLEYKRYSYSDWTDGSDYLTIERTWNDTGFWKFNLILDVPVDIYSARFTFGIDLSCLQYVERSGYEVWINYSANATEQYSMMFNWSDIASIPGVVFTKGVQDDMFWFRFRRDDIPSGHYEFDPTFGHDAGIYFRNGQDIIYGCWYTMGATGGTADNISVQLRTSSGSGKVKCAIYEYTGNTDGGNLVTDGVTEEREIATGGDTDWEVFTFPTPPTLSASTKYFLSVWCEDPGGNQATYWDFPDGNDGIYDNRVYTGSFPSPFDEDGDMGIYKSMNIICSYTEGAPANTAPTIDGEIPANTSTGINVIPQLNVTVDDADDDFLNVTWLSNSSSSWVWFAKNSSIDGATLPLSIVQNNSNFSTELTKYWWSINASDGTTWTNETYHFTTVSNNTVPINSNPVPADTSTGIGLNPLLNITVNDADGNTMNQTFRTNASGTWVSIAWNNNTGNATLSNSTNVFNVYGTKYWWSSNLSDGNGGWDNDTYSFTTNYLPTLSGESPTNTSTDISLTPSLYVICTDADGDLMNATWLSNSSGSWVQFGLNNTFASGTNITQPNNNFSSYSTTYYWSVNCSDDFNWTNETYSFTTVANNPPTLNGEIPVNGSTGISLYPAVNVTCNDLDGDSLTVYFYENTTGSWVLQQTNGSHAANTSAVLGNFSNASSYSTEYWWSVNLTDGTDWVNETYSFTTEAAAYVNTPPSLSNEIPANTSTNIQLYPQLNITVTDADGNNSVVYWYTNETDSIWYLMQTNTTVLNATVRLMNFTNASSYSTTYWWRISANDTIDNTTEIYHFTTLAAPIPNRPPVNSVPSPANGSTGISLNTSLSITVNDPDGNTMNQTFRTNESGSWVSIGWNNNTGNATVSNSTSGIFDSYNTTYWWSSNLTDGLGEWDNDTYSFTTAPPTPPAVMTLTDEYPTNNSINVCPNSMEIGITISNPTGGLMNLTFWSNLSGVWDYFYLGTLNVTINNIGNGTYYINPVFFTRYNFVYYWNVSVSNGTTTINSDVFSFTTASGPCGVGGGGGMGGSSVVGIIGICGLFGILGYIMNRRRRKNYE